MEANNLAASSLIARLSDGLTAPYMSNPDAVPLLTKVLEKGGMAHGAFSTSGGIVPVDTIVLSGAFGRTSSQSRLWHPSYGGGL